MGNNIFERRLQQHIDELHWLYMELYFDEERFHDLCSILETFFKKRTGTLKSMDLRRERHPNWYKDSYGMTLSIDSYSGSIEEMQKTLDYLNECDVNFIHISDFFERPDFSLSGVKSLLRSCHSRHIHACVDLPLSSVPEAHEWARKLKAGHIEYKNYFYFLSNEKMIKAFAQMLPSHFEHPVAEPFTWIPKAKGYVMSSYKPSCFDLNYRNPSVFHAAVTRLLTVANYGVDMIRLTDLSYLWKEFGTNCRDLHTNHTIARLLRLIVEIVCPGVLLSGTEAYYGNSLQPECHVLCDDSWMPTIWHTVATRNTQLLRKKLSQTHASPSSVSFHYLRSQKPIFWNLDYEALLEQYMHQVPHIKYLNQYFLGNVENSKSCGALIDAKQSSPDLTLEDGRLSIGFQGTTASMCGLETNKDDPLSLRLHLTLYACLFMLPGIPVICCGDEIALTNTEGKLSWEKVSKINENDSIESKVFYTLKQMNDIHKKEATFSSNASLQTLETWASEVLCICRKTENEKVIGLFNFSEKDHIAWINENDGTYQDLFTGEYHSAAGLNVPAYGFYYLKKC